MRLRRGISRKQVREAPLPMTNDNRLMTNDKSPVPLNSGTIRSEISNEKGAGTMKRQTRLVALLGLLAFAQSSVATTPEERRAYFDKLVQTLPAVPSFTTWQQRTGELPPDFDALPKINSLPDPLRFLDGHMVKSA